MGGERIDLGITITCPVPLLPEDLGEEQEDIVSYRCFITTITFCYRAARSTGRPGSTGGWPAPFLFALLVELECSVRHAVGVRSAQAA